MQQHWSDEELVQRLKQRDPFALETLCFRYAHRLFYEIRLVWQGGGVAQDAEECVNDLLLAVWQEIETFDATREPLQTWLIRRAAALAQDRQPHFSHQQAPKK